MQHLCVRLYLELLALVIGAVLAEPVALRQVGQRRVQTLSMELTVAAIAEDDQQVGRPLHADLSHACSVYVMKYDV